MWVFLWKGKKNGTHHPLFMTNISHCNNTQLLNSATHCEFSDIAWYLINNELWKGYSFLTHSNNFSSSNWIFKPKLHGIHFIICPIDKSTRKGLYPTMQRNAWKTMAINLPSVIMTRLLADWKAKWKNSVTGNSPLKSKFQKKNKLHAQH